MMKSRSILFSFTLLALFLVTLAACDPKPKETEVPYTELKNYFFRNDAEIPANPKIESREQFDSLFGMATVMGTGGRPTDVDFERQFVIAVILPVANQQTELDGERLFAWTDLLGYSNLQFDYSVDRDSDALSYTTQPVLLIAVDRQYNADNIYLQEVADE